MAEPKKEQPELKTTMPTYSNPEVLREKIEAYFTACEGEILLNADGNPVINRYGEPVIVNATPPTISGLARALGFQSRKDLFAYRSKHGRKYTDQIRDARMRIEEYNEKRLFDREGARGAEFNLRTQFGWVAEDFKKRTEAIASSSGITIINDIPRTAEKKEQPTQKDKADSDAGTA